VTVADTTERLAEAAAQEATMRVLFATDFSESAGVAERLVASIAWPAGTTIRVVTVVPWIGEVVAAPFAPIAPLNAEEIDDLEVRNAHTGIRDACARLRVAGIDATWVVMRGGTSDAIVQVARTEGADLVVLGSRGLNALEGALLGSVSEAVADRAPCPVLIARGETIHRSLIADDGTVGAKVALGYVRDHPCLLGGVSRLFAAQHFGQAWPETFDMPIDSHSVQVLADDQRELWRESRADLTRDADTLREVGQRTDVELDEGAPGDAITDAALRWRADLVVVGSRHRTGLTRFVLGSVGRHVLHHSHCSVLSVGCLPAAARTTEERPKLVAV
jgi:nucleotide-binding universal stress UspA family protein